MSRSILVVDDEPDIRELVRLSFELVGGHRTRTAASGAEALAAVREERPDAVLMDVQMPGMDGPATLQALRAEGHTDLPVVFLTASVLELELVQLRSLDCAGVLAKPFDPLTLGAELDQILGWTS